MSYNNQGYGNKSSFGSQNRSSYSNQNRQSQHQGNAPKTPVPEKKLITKIILSKNDAKLYDETAKAVANEMNTTATQMRNFYDHVLSLLNRAEMNNTNFEEILPFVKMLNSKVSYAKTRGVASSEFADMIEQCVKQVNSKDELAIFKYFFEAVMGFSKK